MRVSAVADVIGGPIAWRESGTPGAPVAVFLHGLGGDRRSWEPQLSGLSDLRHCLAWEVPGYGASPGLIESLPWLGDQAASGSRRSPTVRSTWWASRSAAWSPSTWPWITPSWCARCPCSTPARRSGLDGVTTAEGWLASRITPLHDPRTPTERVRPIVDGLVGPGCPQSVQDSVVETMRAIPPASLEAACRALVRHDTRGRLAEIQAPTLVMVGEVDPDTPPSYAEQIAARITGSTYRVIPGVGHLSNLEAPEIVNDALRAQWAIADRGDA